MKDAEHARQIGVRIRERRLAADLTLVHVAARMGVSFQQVSKWEAGEHHTKKATLAKLAHILGCTTHDFLATRLPLSEDAIAVAQMVDKMKFGGTRHVLKEFVGKLVEWERQITDVKA
jgi:transcriptional regulator with XRE-family HTH domain